MFLCYECGVELKTFGELMFHRKNEHTMNQCLKYLANTCKFTDTGCWYNHSIVKKKKDPEDNSENNLNVSKTSSQPPVFWNPPTNLEPPSAKPTQATWLKMILMMDNLNKMMKEMRESSQFL